VINRQEDTASMEEMELSDQVGAVNDYDHEERGGPEGY